LATGFNTTNKGPLITATTTDAGTSWTMVNGPSGFAYRSSSFGEIALACGSASTCVVVGTGASGPVSSVTTNSGGDWTSSTVG
jgi:hypothetical protein